MPIDSTFTWLGDKVLQAITGDIERKLHTAGAAIRSRAYMLAPKKTGAMAASIDYRVVGSTLTIFVGAPYGMFQEFGTRSIRPHPDIRPALNELGRIFGSTIEMAFNTPVYAQPIIAHQAGFIVPKTLTPKQKAHVAAHLLPTSKRHYKGNVRRARLYARPSP